MDANVISEARKKSKANTGVHSGELHTPSPEAVGWPSEWAAVVRTAPAA
jgi:hypothetical protein